MTKRADLNPPLGFPGGPCYVVQRIREEVRDLRLQGELVEDVEMGESLSNADAAKVYDLEVDRGPAGTRFKQLALTSHAQYRMDQRGITVTELRLALTSFQQRWSVLKSQGLPQAKTWEQDMTRGEKILWVDPRIHLAVVFTVQRGSIANVITAYWEGQADPQPGTCRIAYRGPPEPGVKTLVSPKSERDLPLDQDREKERVLPPGSGGTSVSEEGGGGDRELPGVSENKPDNDIPDRPRTMPEEGENRGVQVKEDYGYVTRRSMRASIDRVVEAYTRAWRPGHRQRRQRGPSKAKTRAYYRKNRNRIRSRARTRYQRARHNPQFQRAQRHRRQHPSQHRRLTASVSVVAALFMLGDSIEPSPIAVSAAFLNEAAGSYNVPEKVPPSTRQKRQKGPDRMDSRREYVRNRPRKNRQMKRRHKLLQRKQQYRKYKKWYNDNYRARGEKRFRRRADGAPDIAFVVGPEMAEGQVRSLSETGMVVFEVLGYDTPLVMPFLAFIESVVFLSETDIEGFFTWADEVLGPEAYESLDVDTLWECASLFEVDPDSDEFQEKCFGLVGERELDLMSPEQLEAINEVLITKTAEGVTFTWEREAPNNEINHPGPNVGYAPSSPTHNTHKPDEKETLPKGQTGPDKHEDDAPAGTSRVLPPGGIRDTGGEETYAKAAAERVAQRWIVAATIDQIQSRADALSRQRSTKVGRPKLVRADPKNGLWSFTVVGSKGDKVYTVKVKGVRKGRALDVQKLDVRVTCSCPAFRWQGPEHWAKIEYYQQGKPQGTATFPKVRDPDHNHPVCKHVLAVFKHMPPMFLDPPTR